ncbi:glycogen/starch/alpha-glucan phosphorylase [Haloplasma contractile]|uniref:Alpha-1,4 glucan phosphorylase n=1 Tax=Haloplasma contractile SSD-17B TaxID=1033810 RepID=U2E895_9MOLU|nr:glycogen/starch/alpha-glucan phosphorylase [Haloplasma contractile]ERJ11111.1 Glycogen phosphorylase protein [Haloplasma contractile SSD-17B]
MTTSLFKNKKVFKEAYVKRVEEMFGKRFDETTMNEKYFTLATMVREYASNNWIETQGALKKSNQKQTYYFSMEFLMGRLLTNNLTNLGIRNLVEEAFDDLSLDLNEIEDKEADPGLGNGGLGRLAACFLDSIASLGYPGHGNGIRYRYGFFEQRIIDGYQVEVPDQWLQKGFVWDVRKENEAVDIPFFGQVRMLEDNGKIKYVHENAEYVKAVPYDVPIIGYDTKTVNNLILWSAEPARTYPQGINAAEYESNIRQISEFLYPDDSTDEGKILRLKQQYFFVAAGLKRIVNNHKEQYGTMENFHEKVCLHINDTHPALLVPELMRVLIDEEGYDWDTAWSITTKTCAYTNHTILAEALEKWPVRLLQPLLPRVFMITEEINKRFCLDLIDRYGEGHPKVTELAIIGEDLVRMAHLAIVGSFSVNGVAALHTNILKEIEMKDFNELFKGRFNNKTNGITHRRWLLNSNPELSDLLTKLIGDGWIKDTMEFDKLMPYVTDEKVKKEFYDVKQARKTALAERIEREQGIKLDPNSIFDIQVKRMHEYKRQLMNILHIMYLYNRLKDDSEFRQNFHPQSFIFGAKAAGGYDFAKKVIKLINTVADIVNNDEETNSKLKLVFVENYNVSYAELIMPAADLSEQISTATKEASGTGNMKFMMNGALTIGTLDGANVEISEFAGIENEIIFGLNADEVNELNATGDYNPWDIYYKDERIRRVLDQLINGYFSNVQPDEFRDIYDNLLHNGDSYYVLKDFDAYINAQEKANKMYQDQDKWLEKALINIAKSGYFSTDRTIEQYVEDIWHLEKIKF